jgi:addiction module HigA family antidote
MDVMTGQNLVPIHPGEILRDLYLEPLDMSAGALARKINVPRTRIERIVAEKVGITSDTALRLSRYFGTTPEFWMNLQTSYDLKIDAAAKRDELAAIPSRDAA